MEPLKTRMKILLARIRVGDTPPDHASIPRGERDAPTLMRANKIFVCGLFCLLGFVGNLLKVELFFNVDFLIGSFFVMLAILSVGGACGAITGFVAGICTYLLWNHPWAIIIFAGEALFVSRLYSRRRGSLVIYDILYWACLGMPMVYLFYHYFMGMQLQSTLVVMLKQSVNGVFNALTASLAHVLFKFMKRSTGAKIAYSQLLFVTMASLVFLPSMYLFITEMRVYQEKRTGAFESRVSFVSKAARKTMAAWIDEHHTNVQILSNLIGDPDASTFDEMQHYVELIKAATPAFKTMGVFNRSSITVSYSPLELDGKSTLGVDFSDRPHIAIMQREKKPFISDVMMSWLGNPSPIVLLLAPIIVEGEYRGYCSGVVNTSQVTKILENLVEEHINITVTDGTNRVIASTIPGLNTMDPFPRPYSLNGAATASEALLWKPDPKPNISFMQQWRSSFFYSTAPLSGNSNWKVIVEASCLPLTEDISRHSLSRLTLLGLLILCAVTVSHLFSNGFISSIVKLQALTKSLPDRFGNDANIEWPKSSIEELAELSNNFENMAGALLHDMAERKQAEAALRLSEERFRSVVTLSPIPMALINREGAMTFLNDRCTQLFGYASDDIPTISEWLQKAYPDASYRNYVKESWNTAAERAAFKGGVIGPAEYKVIRKDGAERVVEITGIRIGNETLACFIDLTERSQATKALSNSLEEKIALLKEVHHRVKNNLQIVASLLGLQAGRTDNPQVVDVLQDTRNRVRSMALLHETLYRSGNLARINFATYLKDLCGQLLISSGPASARVKLEYDVAPIGLPLEQAVPCGLIVSELVSNALKHGFPGNRTGRILVGLSSTEELKLILSVCDDGVGLPSDFNPDSASTLGLQLVSGLADQLSGQLEVVAHQEAGSAFRVVFPVPEDISIKGES